MNMLHVLSRRPHVLSVLAIAGAVVPAAPLAGQCQYEVTAIIQAPPCWITGPPTTLTLALSNNGIVAGYYNFCDSSFNEAFVWTPNPDGQGGTFKTLPRPANVLSATASGVNSAGFVVGSHLIQDGGTRGFIYNPTTEEFKYLLALDPSISGGTLSSLNAINENNVDAGSRRITLLGQTPVISNAVIWYPYGEDGDGREIVVDLGVMDFGPNSAASDLNDDVSIVVGWTGSSTFSTTQFPFVTNGDDGTLLIDGAFGVNYGGASIVTNNLRIIGSANFEQGNRLFVLDPDAFFIIDPLPGWPSSNGGGANDLGQILVNSWSPTIFVPSLWQHGTLMDLAGKTTTPDGLLLGRGRAINNSGQILTSATLGGKTMGVVLTPVDRPAADLNADCKVNVHDLLMLLNSWGPCASESCQADFTGNGSVGVSDLLILLSQWG